MINYIWLALIVIGLGFAAVKDVILKDPVSTTAADRVVWSGTTPDLDSDTETATLNAPLAANDGEGTVSRVRFAVAGADAQHRVVATVVDAEGERFLARCTVKDNVASFDPAAVVAGPENAEAKADAPLTLASVAVRGATADHPVHVGEVSLVFAEKWKVKDKLQSKSWMGVATLSAVAWANTAVELALGYIGIMILWLGLMRIAEEAGLVQLLARVLSPVLCWIFPELPPNSPALGAIVMNVSANMLGLGNAATPLGLKAMQELQKLNTNKDEASNAMVMFLALNTSGFTLLPAGIVGFRAAAGSQHLMDFWPMVVLASTISTITAITVCKIYEKFPIFRRMPTPAPAAAQEVQ